MPQRSSLVRLHAFALATLLAIGGLQGCSMLLTSTPPPDPQTLLRAVESSPESVTLEIFQVRIPTEDTQLAEKLWAEVDEQRLCLDVRRDLVRNGFRAGVLGGTLPDVLAEKLKLQSSMPAFETDRQITGDTAAPSVVRRVLQLNPHNQATVQAADLREHLHVLVNSDEGLQGQSFDQVQAAYSLRAEQSPGQRVVIELTPELQHGEMRNRYAGSDQGIFLVTPSRERKVYDHLTLQTELCPGELLVVGCLPDSPKSLGRAFHGLDIAGPAQQKLVLVRMLQVPPSEILADARPPGR